MKKIILFLGDVLVWYFALYLTLGLRFQALPSAGIWRNHLLPFTVLFFIWLIVFYISDLYSLSVSKNDVEFYNKILRNTLINFGIGMGYFYLLTDKLFNIKPQTVYFIFMAVSILLLASWRYFFNQMVQRPAFMRNVLVIGMKDEAIELIEEIFKKPQLGYRITSIIHSHSDGLPKLPGMKFYNADADIKKILEEEKISTIVTSLDPRSNPELVKSLFDSLILKIQFYDLASFYEKLTGKVPVTTIGHIWFLENLAEADKSVYEFSKRLFDIFVAALGLLLSIPAIPLILLSIRLESKGPIFFTQTRIGYLGQKFRAIKFRSMIDDAEENGGPQWAQKNDPRVTKVGKFLRATRLDEIPQLINVLRGEMSMIGPRPERPEFIEQLQDIIPFYAERHLVKPGLTGWAQINFQYGSSAGDALKKLQYDLFYIKNRSIPLDAGIILKTINIILSGKGR